MLKSEKLNNTHEKMIKVARIMTVLSCVLILSSLIFLHLAKPEWQTGIMVYKGVAVTQSWSKAGLLITLPLSLISSILLSFVLLIRYIEFDKKDSPLFVHLFMSLVSWAIFGFVALIIYKELI